MFLAEYVICITLTQCLVLQDDPPVFFKTEEVCLNHAEAKLKPQLEKKQYAYVLIGCKAVKGRMT